MLTRRSLIGAALLAGARLKPVAAQSDRREFDPPTSDIRIALKLTALDGSALSSAEYETAANILFNRAESLGLRSAGYSTFTPDRVVIYLTGPIDVELAMTVITSRGLVELIDPKGILLDPGSYVVTSLGGEPWPRWNDEPIVTVEGEFETIVSGQDIASASRVTNQLGQPVVGFELNDAGSDALKRFTAANIGQPLAIVVDNRVISSPIVNSVIEREGIIEGLSESEVDALLIQLQLEPINARIEIERYAINPDLLDD